MSINVMLFFIYAPSYDDNSGGSIALHRLCHIINKSSDHNAYLVPFGYRKNDFLKKIKAYLKGNIKRPKNYKKNPNWDTPIWNKINIPSTGVVIYPEITENNPLEIKNVVRWLLHQPGFHTGQINYGENELYFKFNSAIKDFKNKNSFLSKNELKVIYYPIDIYNATNTTARDIESCYMVRKGNYKKFIHDGNSIQLDGKTHTEISAIFRRAKRFICYDDYTAYSIFAILCGCESIVVPGENVSIDSWYPNESDRFGIAYGITENQLEWARSTQHKVLEHVINEHKKTEERVSLCLQEIEEFFNAAPK